MEAYSLWPAAIACRQRLSGIPPVNHKHRRMRPTGAPVVRNNICCRYRSKTPIRTKESVSVWQWRCKSLRRISASISLTTAWTMMCDIKLAREYAGEPPPEMTRIVHRKSVRGKTHSLNVPSRLIMSDSVFCSLVIWCDEDKDVCWRPEQCSEREETRRLANK